MRVFRLARSWHSLNYFITTIGSSIKKIGPFLVLCSLFLFSYIILGMELFANILRFNRNNEAVPVFGGLRNDTSPAFSVPDSSFDNFLEASLSTFVVIANDGWTPVYFNHYRMAPVASTVFFISLIIIG